MQLQLGYATNYDRYSVWIIYRDTHLPLEMWDCGLSKILGTTITARLNSHDLQGTPYMAVSESVPMDLSQCEQTPDNYWYYLDPEASE